MKHLEFLNLKTNFDSKDIVQRLNGRFFTPGWMARDLARQIVTHWNPSSSRICLVDPFCGDGRLVVALLQEFIELPLKGEVTLQIELWDNCKLNLEEAKTSVNEASKAGKFQTSVVCRQWDTLIESHKKFGTFDIVITNPPWESIKPDTRELQGLALEERQTFKNVLREYDLQLSNRLPHSQPTKKLYGWGTNLSRCGLEVSVNLLNISGFCGIVLPSSILSDQVSSPLRKWFLGRANLKTINHFPAEARPFANVDQPSIFTVFQRQDGHRFSRPAVTRHDRKRKPMWTNRIEMKTEELELMEFRIPAELSSSEFSLLKKFSAFQPLSNWEISNGGKLWIGRELDETNYRSFTSQTGEFAFLKGRGVQRFGHLGELNQFIRPGSRKIPISSQFQRIAWRDVSRRSQVRRMSATIIPKGVVTGNSLHVGYFCDSDANRLKALLAIFNSFVFEFQLRARLGTGHISVGSVRGVCIPDLNDNSLVIRLSEFVDRAMSGDINAEVDIESLLADAFSLSKSERDVLISYFTGLPPGFESELRNKLDVG